MELTEDENHSRQDVGSSKHLCVSKGKHHIAERRFGNRVRDAHVASSILASAFSHFEHMPRQLSWSEHAAVNRGVVGSNPTRGASTT